MREVLKKTMLLLFILSIPLVATSASADFVNSSIGYMRHHAEVIHMILFGFGMVVLASFIKSYQK